MPGSVAFPAQWLNPGSGNDTHTHTRTHTYAHTHTKGLLENSFPENIQSTALATRKLADNFRRHSHVLALFFFSIQPTHCPFSQLPWGHAQFLLKKQKKTLTGQALVVPSKTVVMTRMPHGNEGMDGWMEAGSKGVSCRVWSGVRASLPIHTISTFPQQVFS